MKRSPLVTLFLTIFIDLLGFGLIIPQIPNYIEHYGGTAAVGGWLLACYSGMQLLFSPIWGTLSDRYGRRPIILIGLIGSACSFLAFGAAPNLIVLFVARCAAGALTAATLPTAQAYIADVTPPEKRSSGMAIIGAAFGLGFAAGPWLGAEFSQFSVFGYSKLATPAFLAAGLSLLNFALACFTLKETHHNRSTDTPKRELSDLVPGILRALRNPVVGAQLTVYAFSTFAFAAVESSFIWLVKLRFHLNDVMAERPCGYIFGIIGVTALITQLVVMAGLARRVGEHRLVAFGAICLTCSLVGIAYASTLQAIYLLGAFVAIGNGIMTPSLNALITLAAVPSERGAISGTQQGVGSLARIIAPPINNTLIVFNTAVPFIGSAVLMAIATVLSLGLKARPTAELPEEPVSIH